MPGIVVASSATPRHGTRSLLGPFQEKDVVWNDALVSAIKSVGFETFPRDMGEFLHSLYGELLTYEADLIDAAVRKLECFEAAAVAKLDGKTATSGPSPLRPDWMRITAQTVTELIEKDTPTDELRVYFEWAMRKADMFASEPVEIAPGLWGRSSSPEGIDMMQRLFAHVGNPTAMA